MPSLVCLRHSRFLLLVAALVFASAAQATTILYSEVISGYGGPTDESPSGTLGGIAFGGLGGTPQAAVLELFLSERYGGRRTFLARRGSRVRELSPERLRSRFSIPAATYWCGERFSRATASSSASTIPTRGFGFGSHQGVLPSDPTFPGQPLYRYSIILNGTSDVGTYDLKGNDVIFSVNAASCVNFPGPCGAPFALATTAGDSFVNENFGGQFGTFTASLVLEASTWVMMLLGFAGLGFAGYHRAKSGQKTSSAA